MSPRLIRTSTGESTMFVGVTPRKPRGSPSGRAAATTATSVRGPGAPSGPRCTVTVTVWPGRVGARASTTSCGVVTGRPSTATIRSPGARRPADGRVVEHRADLHGGRVAEVAQGRGLRVGLGLRELPGVLLVDLLAGAPRRVDRLAREHLLLARGPHGHRAEERHLGGHRDRGHPQLAGGRVDGDRAADVHHRAPVRARAEDVERRAVAERHERHPHRGAQQAQDPGQHESERQGRAQPGHGRYRVVICSGATDPHPSRGPARATAGKFLGVRRGRALTAHAGVRAAYRRHHE